MIYLGIVAFVRVFLLAWQQQNISHGYKWWAIATSYGISMVDVVVVLGTVHYGIEVIPFVGTGGALGVITAMVLHKRIRK